jgi:[acyl-carrier-protein] S-malonyltransferase
MSIAFVFPGQGSQSVGMQGALAAAHPVVTEVYAEGSAVLGYDLWQLVAQGPVELLNATERTQPAMLAAGVASWRLWRQLGGPVPAIVSGHSLGEFTALVCAEAIEFKTAIQLVQVRGQLMQSAVPVGTGSMAAVLGMEDAELEAICAEAAQGQVVEAVNYNSPGQVVIAGHAAAVERAIALAKARGAKRAVTLPVSVPSHSSLMRGAAEQLRERLDAVELRRPRLQYLSAVDAALHADPSDIRATLVRQLASPVRWSATVLALTAAGAGTLIECGPGKVLTGLNRRIERRPEISCLALEDATSIQLALQAVQAGGTHA